MFSWSCEFQCIRYFACKPKGKYRHNKLLVMVAVTKLDQKKYIQFLPQWIMFYWYRLQRFMACSAECLMVMLMHFMTWFWQLSWHPLCSPICVLSFPLHLETRHTLPNIKSHLTSFNHLCPVVFLCHSADAKVKWICWNNTSDFYIFTFVAT